MGAAARGYGLVGLGTVGRNLALNILDRRFSLAAWDRDPAARARATAEGGGGALAVCGSLAALARTVARPRRVLLLVPAGPAVDEVLAALAPRLSEGDVVVDCGNAHFADTDRRAEALRRRGLRYLGVGLSGGAAGARWGPALMAGGHRSAYTWTAPLWEAIAARGPEGPCVGYFGEGGAGHFVKMAHNAIEYADMQAIAEVYDLMRRLLGWDAFRAARAFAAWDRGPLASFLVASAARVLAARDPVTGQPLVDIVEARADQKGTGAWAVAAARVLGVPCPSFAAAVDARLLSRRVGARESLAAFPRRCARPTRGAPGGRPIGAADLAGALLAARLAAYAQGADLLAAGAARHRWDLSPAEAARVWSAGCIIRARALLDVRRAYRRNPLLPHLFRDATIRRRLAAAAGSLRRTVAAAAAAGVPVPVLGAALAYADAFWSARPPQNLTQAQRDFFGAHGYRRTDRSAPSLLTGGWDGSPASARRA